MNDVLAGKVVLITGGARVLCVVVAAVSLTASATDYPTRPVRVIVGLTAGSGVDVMAQIVGQKLAEATGQPFIIENRPGAGSNIATRFAAQAAPERLHTFRCDRRKRDQCDAL